jgi:hypothetical protein
MSPMSDDAKRKKINDDPSAHFADYSLRDHEIVDYQFYQLPQLPGIGFRGPQLPDGALESGNFFTAIGAAQTVGVYIEKPYPQLLSERIGLPALNLGLGGASPSFYADHPQLLELANRGKFVILQVMTARTQPNSRLESVSVTLLRDVQSGQIDTSEALWTRIMQEQREQLPRYVEESLASWRDDYARLIAQIKVPVIWFYFAHKPENETTNFDAKTVQELYGSFPQFVDMGNVRKVGELCADYAECRSSRNINHELRSRFTGAVVEVDYGDIHPSARGMKFTRNPYYPSAEMHQDAMAALLPAVARIGYSPRS